jgi:hypothetical protein
MTKHLNYEDVLKALIAIAIMGIITNIYACNTKFDRIITVNNIRNVGTARMNTQLTLNLVMDENDVVYTFYDSPLIGHLKSARNFLRIKEGKRYHVKGYGIRIPLLHYYPNITHISEIKNK